MKKQITQQERLQIVGLMTLARQHYKVVQNCEGAMAAIVGSEDPDYCDQLSDEIYGSETFDVDAALRNMKIEVLE